MTRADLLSWLEWLTAPNDGPVLALLALVLLALVLGRHSRPPQ